MMSPNCLNNMAHMNDAYHLHMQVARAIDLAGRYKLGEFHFDAVTGEVTGTSTSNGAGSTRLAPKPAALLRMLIDKHNELLTIDEIRSALWPDVQVEFDQGVHTCMRQIRAALGDSASSPKYIETLPRRGYRLMIPAMLIDSAHDSTDALSANVPTVKQSRRWRIAVLIIITILLPLIAAFSIGTAQHRQDDPIPLAIMAFKPPAESTLTDIANVATLLLAEFGGDPAYSVIGPSTTIRFASSDEPLVGAIRELDVRYIINGRFIRRDDRDQVLVELVRTSDGAHIWVQLYDDTHSAAAIAEQVSIHVRDVLRAGDHPIS